MAYNSMPSLILLVVYSYEDSEASDMHFENSVMEYVRLFIMNNLAEKYKDLGSKLAYSVRA